MHRLISLALAAALAGGVSITASAQNLPALPAAPPAQEPWVPPAPGQPVEKAPPHGKTQTPAFPGQTRGPYHPSNIALNVQTVADGLEHPWGLAFLPDGRMLVTEKQGRMRIVSKDGTISPPIAGIPSVDARQGGALLDVEIDPDFAKTSLIYWSYAEPRGEGSGTTVARARLVTAGGGAHVEGIEYIFRMMPTVDSVRSFGSRMAFGKDGTLYIGTGDRDFDQWRPMVQDPNTDIGKVVRINRDGSIPKDNPYLGQAGYRPELWAIGFRNVLGVAIDPATGGLWTNENGPFGGDELNHVRGGKNYGWPVISYGMEYSGKPIEEGLTQKAGMEQPVYYWDPVIAPSGMTFYTGDLFPAWKGSLFIGSLRQKHLVRLELQGDKVVGEERLITDENERIRDVRQGPDGALYLLTDADKGRVLRLSPKGP